MNFSISLQISGSIWMQGCVWSPCSVFIKINCIVAGYGVRPSLSSFQSDTSFRKLKWGVLSDVLYHRAHFLPFPVSILLHALSHWSTLLRLKLPGTHFLANPCCPPVFAHILPSSLVIKWASLSPMVNPPTTQLLLFLCPFLRDGGHGIINPFKHLHWLLILYWKHQLACLILIWGKERSTSIFREASFINAYFHKSPFLPCQPFLISNRQWK